MSVVVPQPAPSADGAPVAPTTTVPEAGAERAVPVPEAVAERDLPVPAVVRRNTWLLATSQAIVGAGTQMVPALGAIMVQQLHGPLALAGLASSLLGVSRFLVAYPVGRLTDRRGRVAGILAGQAVSLLGAVLLGACLVLGAFWLFVLGLLIFGLGVGAGQQLRLAAADMFLPARRAEGLGYVMTGSLLGVLGGPLLLAVAEVVARPTGVPTIAVAWWLVPGLVLPSMVLVARVRPDPREIAGHLTHYYPGYRPPAPQGRPVVAPEGLGAWLRFAPTRVAYVATAGAQGAMAVMMAITPLSLAHHGHALAAISVAVAVHVVGMFGCSLPVGWLSDRLGHRRTMLAGTGVCALGALLGPVSPDYWVATLGIFLVGLGWSGVTVAATAQIADVVPPQARGRAVGAGDTLAGVAAIACPLLASVAVGAYGLSVLGPVVCLLLAPAMLLLLRPGPRRGLPVA